MSTTVLPHERASVLPEDFMTRFGEEVRGLLDGAPRFPLRLIAEDGQEMLVHPSAGHPAVGKWRPGTYEARLHTPWGQVFPAKATVEGGEIKLRTRPGRFHQQALSWLLFEPGILARLAARRISEQEHSQQYGIDYAFWTQKTGLWTPASEEVVRVVKTEFHVLQGQLVGRLQVRVRAVSPVPLWFTVRNATLPAQVVALPPVSDVEIIILPGRPERAKMQVIARSRQTVSRELGAFLACGDATVVDFLLRESERVPFEPDYFFFHLMRSHFGGAEARDHQPKALSELAPSLADGYIAEAHGLMTGEKPDLAEIRARLLAGLSQGIPVWSISLKELHDELGYLLQHSASKDGELLHAFSRIDRYVLASEPASSVWFFAHTPDKPLFEAPVVNAQVAGELFLAEKMPERRADAEPVPTPSEPRVADDRPARGNRKRWVGVVVSTKMQKTIVVRVEDRKPHRIYRKIIKVSKKYLVHDENGDAREGDTVRIAETRPYSKWKHTRLVEVLSRGGAKVARFDNGRSERDVRSRKEVRDREKIAA